MNPVHMHPELCYRILKRAMELANARLEATGRLTQIVLPNLFSGKYVSKDQGRYVLAPFESMKESDSNASFEG